MISNQEHGSASSSPTILIADDDADFRKLLAIRCANLGTEVIESDSAVSALAKADAREPALIILDVNMPAGNGMAACEMLSSHERLSSVPVIIVSGNRDPDIERRCNAMAAYYVPKCDDTWSRLEPADSRAANA